MTLPRRPPPVSVRVLPPDDWRILRGLRLAALADASAALGSKPDSARRWTERHWRGWPSRGVPIAAFHGVEPVGLVGAVTSATDARTVDLVALWVAPPARGTGTGDALVEAVLAVAGEWGSRSVRLEVLVANHPAIRLYRRHGFVLSAETPATVGAVAMRRELAGPSGP